MPKAKLTKRFIESIPFTEEGQIIYSDTDLAGFGLVVGRKSKTYFAQRDVKGRTVRTTIGKHGLFTTDAARSEAKELLIRMSKGENPNQAKRAVALSETTLSQAIENYKEGKKHLSQSILTQLKYAEEKWFSDWKSLPLTQIKKEMIFKSHAKIGKENGEATANQAMRTLRAVYNFAMLTNEALPSNPVRTLSLSKSWFEEKRRNSIIKPTQIKPWYEEVMLLDNSAVRDFLRLLLFTGMRKSEALSLQWKNIDFDEKTITVPDTKNGKPLLIPMSDYVHDLLKERKKRTRESGWVFPSHSGSGHLVEPKRTIANVAKNVKIKFMLHDLRRTFITIAESLDISAYAVKQLVNHSQGGDVTAGYVIMNIERLRDPMQKIAKHILEKIAASKTKIGS